MIDLAFNNGTIIGVFAEFTLAHITAALNATATVLLVWALIAIKQNKEVLHKNLMLTAFAVSVAFLAFYVTRYLTEGNKGFPKEAYPTASYFYYALLASHVLLAISVPVFALISIYHGLKGINGLKEYREKHRRVVKLAFPIWLYVSVTGVIVYFMLYWIFVAPTPEVVT